ncbi:hypothetical protein J5X91_11370 [Pseudoalteromonas sp. K222D]|nr:hypothetical protein [Pseudoalteromonas sp. K222D]MBO7926859.1 hypothetical protein [Pseudoalteromonas sp. K222D]
MNMGIDTHLLPDDPEKTQHLLLELQKAQDEELAKRSCSAWLSMFLYF